jgi:hypothetical protein
MANNTVDTTGGGYQLRLTQIREIKTFYGPMIKEYLAESPDRQKAWRQNDPILWELLDIWHRIENLTEDPLND